MDHEGIEGNILFSNVIPEIANINKMELKQPRSKTKAVANKDKPDHKAAS